MKQESSMRRTRSSKIKGKEEMTQVTRSSLRTTPIPKAERVANHQLQTRNSKSSNNRKEDVLILKTTTNWGTSTSR
jgi:hypothetical protein